MASSSVPTETLKFTDVRPKLSQLLNRIYRNQDRVLITRSGIPVGALVSVEDLHRLERLDAEREADFAVFERIGSAFADQTDEEIARGAAEAVAQARADLRAERDAVKT